MKYTCPNCGEAQTTVVEAEGITCFWEYDLNKKDPEPEKVDEESNGGHIGWYCPSCNDELPSEIVYQVEKILGWR